MKKYQTPNEMKSHEAMKREYFELSLLQFLLRNNEGF